MRTKDNSGFTLIELLVVTAIISLLSSIALASMNTAREKARDARRKADLVQVQTALELYYNDTGAYPSTGSQWWGMSALGGSRTNFGANSYIPDLTPNYMVRLPIDPQDNRTGWSGYLYRSDGVAYKFLSHSVGPESFPSDNPFFDPIRPTWAWMVCSAEPACGTW